MSAASDLVAKLKFPDEWYTAPWDKCEILASGTLARTGKPLFFAGGTLDDGTCLYGLTFPRGQRVMRLSPLTGWAIEERFKGDPPKKDRPVVNRLWRKCVESLVESKQLADKELGKGGPDCA